MKVLWLSHLIPWPPSGGVLQRSYNLLREVAGRHDIHLLALHQRAQLASARLPEARKVLEALGVKVEIFPIPADASRLRWGLMLAGGLLRATPYDVNWLRSRCLHERTLELSKGKAFDCIHVDTLGMAPYAKPFARTPMALNHHNVESQMMERRARNETSVLRRSLLAYEARRLARYERRVCPAAAVNIVVSELDAERLRRVAGPVGSVVVENGVDVGFFRPTGRVDERPKSLVFAGGMSWYPNREAVLFLAREIWPRLVAADPEHSLRVVGAHPPREILELAGRDERVTAPGFVDDVRPEIEAASIYVCPIRDGGGTRLKILDALAMGRPLVATHLAVEGIALREGEHYLPAETPEEFVEQILRLDRDAGLRVRLAQAGRSLMEQRCAWPVVGERLDRAWHRAADQG